MTHRWVGSWESAGIIRPTMSSDKLDYYDFWNKLPGPGPFDYRNFSAIPVRNTLTEGMRLGLLEYLGVRWVMESASENEVVIRRTDRELRVRLSRTYRDNEGGPCFILWAKTHVPDAQSFDVTVGLGTFKQALRKELDADVEYRARIVPEAEGMFKGLEVLIAMRLDSFPPRTEDGSVARWMTWATLALQWSLESIEANPNP